MHRSLESLKQAPDRTCPPCQTCVSDHLGWCGAGFGGSKIPVLRFSVSRIGTGTATKTGGIAHPRTRDGFSNHGVDAFQVLRPRLVVRPAAKQTVLHLGPTTVIGARVLPLVDVAAHVEQPVVATDAIRIRSFDVPGAAVVVVAPM